MKKTNLTISFDSEKLDALIFYTEKKDIDLQTELSETIQKLYEKHVALSTREYIESRLERENMSKEKTEKSKLTKEKTLNETN